MGTDDEIPEQLRDGEGTPPGVDAPAKALVRLTGEVTTKSRRTRRRFLRRLADNVRDALESHGFRGRVDDRWSRFFLEAEDERALDLLSRIFGISSFSRVEGECQPDLDAIVRLGEALFHDRVRGRRYAVRARRSGDHGFRSRDVEHHLGAALNPGAEVDLDHPDVTVRVEVREDRAYLFSGRRPGAGGLPLGVQGKGLVLASGGYDSAVAAWMAMRRGVPVDYLFCNLGGSAYRRLALEVLQRLSEEWSYGTRPRVHVLDFGPLVEEMRSRVQGGYLQVVLKRLMYRAGSAVAEEAGAEALVTGESVGQVSSQTLANLRAIDEAADRPVLRPLLGFDKEEIMDRARSIGTYELSARVREYCSLAEDHPVTAATLDRARQEEERVDREILDRVLEGREVLDLRALDPAELAVSSVFVRTIPDDAVVLDTRDRESFRRWHWSGARHREFGELSEDFGQLDPELTYVLYCEVGTKTAHLAERMQSAGYEAYSVQGGVRALRRRENRGETK